MKKIIILLIALLPVVGFAQKAKKDIQKTSFEVNGVCGMCKARIEKQAFTIKGVKSATWDISSHQFSVIYDASKTSLLNITKNIINYYLFLQSNFFRLKFLREIITE